MYPLLADPTNSSTESCPTRCPNRSRIGFGSLAKCYQNGMPSACFAMSTFPLRPSTNSTRILPESLSESLPNRFRIASKMLPTFPEICMLSNVHFSFDS
jgi:hypothetical protein